MKIEELLLEAPKKKKPAKKKAVKKKAVKKKTNKDLYKPQPIAELDMQEAAIRAAAKVATFMKGKCQPWLKASKNGTLIVYRGISDRGGLAFTKKTREDREPKDTENDRHKAFDAAITAAGGVANRTNSLFCSANKARASIYGKVYVLIPVGLFNYTWSPEWSDWTGDAEVDELTKIAKPFEQDPAVLEKIKALKAKIPAYKAKKMKQVEDSLRAEIQKLPPKIKKMKARLAAMKYKKSWSAYDLKRDINYYEQRVVLLKDPVNFKKKVIETFKDQSYYDNANPEKEIRNLQSRSEYRDIDELQDPSVYDPVKVKKVIVADRELDKAVKSGNEIMISCPAGLYVQESFFKDFVRPTLLGKKITAKYKSTSTSNYDDDDDDGYW